MATIIKRNATRNSIRDGVARTNVITIDEQGLIRNIQVGYGTDLRDTNTVVMGYAGDNNVTLLKFKLGFVDIAESDLLTRYRAVVVFKHESTDETISLPISGTTNDITLPKAVTVAGSYQMHYILQELIDAGDIVSGGHLGPEDEPAFREVFVSDVIHGLVLDSGHSLVGDWDEDDVYNYELASVILDEWTEVDDYYTASFVAQGIKSSVGTDIYVNPESVVAGHINVFLPEDFEEENLEIEYTASSKTIAFTASESHTGQEIQIIYPVNFTTPDDTSTVRKPNIDVIWTRGANESISVQQGTYPAAQLGVKLDSYVTAINVGLLAEQLNKTENNVTLDGTYFVAFIQGDLKYICPTYDELCWVPLGVTHTPGVWQVIVIMKTTDYTFYNGVIQLSVLNSFLKRQDLATEDVTAVSLYDSEEFIITDYNNAQLYVTEVTDATKRVLKFTAAQIDANLTFVDTLSRDYTAEQIVYVLDRLAESGYDYDISELEKAVERLDATATEHGSEINSLKAADTALSNRINEIEDISEDLATETATRISQDTQLQTQITANLNAFNNYKTSNDNQITQIQSKNAEQEIKIGANQVKIDGLEAQDINLQNQISLIASSISDYGNYKTIIHDEIANRAAGDANLSQKIDNETSRATAAEHNLGSAIAAEEERASEREHTLGNALNDEINRATEIENNLQDQITSNDEDIATINRNLATHQETLQGHGGRITGLETQVDNITSDKTIVRNDYNPTIPGVIVASIKFISSTGSREDGTYKTAEEVFEALAEKDPNTLYLLQEEE